ncbi:MAG: DUF1911 domain-containing protein [Treponemataceae bacterium]|nr:DUF1911 domain-containing protein [Treponemataceae bacterium]
MRDSTKTLEFYKKVYDMDSGFIENDRGRIQRIIEQRGADFETIPSCYSGIANDYFLRFYVSYTIGMSREELLPDVKKCIENGLLGCNGNVYGDLERILYLTIIFSLHEYNDDIKTRLTKFKGYQDIYMEHLYHFIDDSFEITAEKLFWQKECKSLFEVIQLAQTDKDAGVQRLKTFVDKQWFKALKDGIITNNSKCYRGFWCIEAAALVKSLGLDDTELKDCKHYPYDMAHFCD